MRLGLLGFTLLAIVSVLVFVTSSAAQSNSIDTKLAAQYFQELKQTSDRDGGKMWGLPLYGPILFVDPNSRNAVANQADLEGKLVAQDGVFIGKLPNEMNASNTATDWAGVHWTMVLWPVSDFRQPRERLLLHECFHRLQKQLGLPARDAVNAHLDDLNGRIWIQMEWRALERALRTSGQAQREAIADALLFRAYRRSLFPEAEKNETALELNEGLAEYTGVRLSSADLQETVVRADLILRQARNNPTFARSFAYISGPAYGALLDLVGGPSREVSGGSGRPLSGGARRTFGGGSWPKSLTPSSDLGELLRQRFGIRLSVSEAAARAAVARYNGQEIIALETKQEQRRKREIAEAKKKFLDGPTLILSVTADVNYSYDPNNVIGVDGSNTVYPTLRMVDAWGVLTVTNGAWLERDTAGHLTRARVPAPTDLSARPLKGDGWSLELTNGWTILPSDHPGDLKLNKRP